MLLSFIDPRIATFYFILSSKIGVLSIKPWIYFLDERYSFLKSEIQHLKSEIVLRGPILKI